jgi:hypothetical protein
MKSQIGQQGILAAELERKMREENLRPSISDDIPKHWKSLMENCWKKDPRQRPGISDILLNLDGLQRVSHTYYPPTNEWSIELCFVSDRGT